MLTSQIMKSSSSSRTRRSCTIAMFCLLLLFACNLPRVTSFQTTTTTTTTTNTRRILKTTTTLMTPTCNTKLQLKKAPEGESSDHSKRNNKKTRPRATTTTTKKTFTVYKDDCFGFTTFLAGIGSRDAVFVSIFIVLSLAADFGTRLGWLPPDTLRPYIVDRKVPGVVAAMTLALTPFLTPLVLSSGLALDIPEPAPTARTLQLAVCSFSMITAFLDIRWRDRFDYPEEFYQKDE